MSGPTMEFSEFSLNGAEGVVPSAASETDGQSEDSQRRQVRLEQTSFAELASEMYGVLAQPGSLSAKTLGPLLDLLPSRTTINEQAQNGETMSQPALLMELLSSFGVSQNSPTPAQRTEATASASEQSTAKTSAEPDCDRSDSAAAVPEQPSVVPIKPEPVAILPGPSEAKIPAAPPAALSLNQVVESALRALSILKRKVSSVTSVTRVDDGWRVSAELVERAGVPDTSDVLGLYEMRLDHAGNVLAYERTHMRRRCDLCR